MKPKFLFLPFMLLSAFGCASTSKTFYDKEGIQRVRHWEIVFAYESGELERTISNQGESTARVMKTGQLSTDLQLRDDIFFMLQDDFGVPVTRETAIADGQIRLHPVHFASGGFKSLDVFLYDKTETLLARVRVKNGNRNATFKDDDDFAEYAAQAIGDLLKLTSDTNG